MAASGHSVGPDVLATASNLAICDLFVVGGASQSFTSDEITALSSWVQGGGLLLVFSDRDLNSSPLNTMLAGIGSSIQFGPGSMDQNFYFNGGVFATTGVAGQWMSGTPGIRVNGGIGLTRGGAGWTNRQKSDAEAYIHYEAIGSGFVFAFGDRLDHDYFNFSAGTPRLRFFQNLSNFEPKIQENPVDPPPVSDDPPVQPPTGGEDPVTAETPEPGTFALMAAGGLGIWMVRKRAARLS